MGLQLLVHNLKNKIVVCKGQHGIGGEGQRAYVLNIIVQRTPNFLPPIPELQRCSVPLFLSFPGVKKKGTTEENRLIGSNLQRICKRHGALILKTCDAKRNSTISKEMGLHHISACG
eukprot:GGOE01064532.1.p2 GENE.GGOE01064532.1~~GGOE01064532.1.p2  ORF type:complete len:117 (+),score=11.03 GGOE01064532.1:138-488(+)